MSYTTKRIAELEKKTNDLQTENEFMRKEIRRLNKKLLMKSDECALFMAKCKTLEDKIYKLKPDDRELYKIVEKACKEAIDRSREKRLIEFDDGSTAYEVTDDELPHIIYECDGRACEVCHSTDCQHTTDIEHAKNFMQPVKGIFEEKTRGALI